MSAFIRKAAHQNYDVLNGFSWYVPGVSGMFVMLAWILAGALLGNLVIVLFSVAGMKLDSDCAILVSYPVQFLPAMLYAKSVSNRNMLFETGYKADCKHFAPVGGLSLALVCVASTIALSFWSDLLGSFLPSMPDSLKALFESMTGGNVILNLLCVSVMAPFFEEWLCRGTILRGLLCRVRPDGTRMKPWLAIGLSALFFAVIHLNPWQALAAFLIGVLMGFVYYRTGSLKLTMLMHCANNSLAVLLGNIDSFKDAESWLDILPMPLFILFLAVAGVCIAYSVKLLLKVNPLTPQGSCEEISTNIEDTNA